MDYFLQAVAPSENAVSHSTSFCIYPNKLTPNFYYYFRVITLSYTYIPVLCTSVSFPLPLLWCSRWRAAMVLASCKSPFARNGLGTIPRTGPGVACHLPYAFMWSCDALRVVVCMGDILNRQPVPRIARQPAFRRFVRRERGDRVTIKKGRQTNSTCGWGGKINFLRVCHW